MMGMDTIGYLFSVAFSGSDTTRAIWFVIIGALVASKYLPPWKCALLMLIIDRIWPFLSMAADGADVRAVSAAVGHAITSVPSDFLIIAVRGVVFYLIIVAGYQLRLRLHGKQLQVTTGKR